MGKKSKRIKLEAIPCELQDARYRELSKEWFETHKKWCPLFGNLPEHEIGKYNPSDFSWICIDVIRKARILWDVYPSFGKVEKDGLDEYGRDPRKFLSSWPEPEQVSKYPSKNLLEARKIFDFYIEIIDEAMRHPLPHQLPTEMWYHSAIDYPLYDDGAAELIIKGARSKVGQWTIAKFIPDYAILAILAIHEAWEVLQSLILENRTEDDPKLWERTHMAQGLLNHAEKAMEETIRKERAQKGGQVSKKQEGFSLVAKYALENSKKKDTLSLWLYLKKILPELELKGGNRFGKDEALFESKEYKGAMRDVITLYKPDGKSKDIGFRAFQRYISDLKKKSQ